MLNKKNIPLLRPFISQDAIDLVVKTLSSDWIGFGSVTRSFEKKIAELIKNPLFLSTNSGTAALKIAYELAGVTESKEVITSPFTCLATNVPILQLQATPIWADIKLDGTIDPQSVESLITEKTSAIVAVHFGGLPADLNELKIISSKYSIPIIEDAAHALCSIYQDKPIGTNSEFCCFSFQSVKLLTTSDGGGISFLKPEFHDVIMQKRWFGINRDKRMQGDYDVDIIGDKYELNDVAASIGLGNLQHISYMIEHRRKIAAIYCKRLSSSNDVQLTNINKIKLSNFWLFPILVKERNCFTQKLKCHGIETSPIHYRNDKVKLFEKFQSQNLLNNVSKWSEKMTCLPIGTWVTEEDANYICSIIQSGW